jgi:hypothetical protein
MELKGQKWINMVKFDVDEHGRRLEAANDSNSANGIQVGELGVYLA